jgi:hypothetical protein
MYNPRIGVGSQGERDEMDLVKDLKSSGIQGTNLSTRYSDYIANNPRLFTDYDRKNFKKNILDYRQVGNRKYLPTMREQEFSKESLQERIDQMGREGFKPKLRERPLLVPRSKRRQSVGSRLLYPDNKLLIPQELFTEQPNRRLVKGIEAEGAKPLFKDETDYMNLNDPRRQRMFDRYGDY